MSTLERKYASKLFCKKYSLFIYNTIQQKENLEEFY